MLPIWFVYIASALRIFGGLAYLRATIRGEAKPNAISWLLWSIIPMVVFAAELQAGVGLIAIATLALGISPLLVFIATIIKNRSSFELKGFNLLCATIAVIGIIVWATTNTPEFAIIAMILADIASALPTLRKIWHKPKTEYPPSFLISASSMLLVLLTITEWSFAVAAFPVYVLTINLSIYWLIHRRIKTHKAKRRRRKKR